MVTDNALRQAQGDVQIYELQILKYQEKIVNKYTVTNNESIRFTN